MNVVAEGTKERGIASMYGDGDGFAGKKTANGEIYDPQQMTAAHKTLPFNTRVRVTFNGKSVIVRINDRGPFVAGRIIDLSVKAGRELGIDGIGQVEIEVVGKDAEAGASPSKPCTLAEMLVNMSPHIQDKAAFLEAMKRVSNDRGIDINMLGIIFTIETGIPINPYKDGPAGRTGLIQYRPAMRDSGEAVKAAGGGWYSKADIKAMTPHEQMDKIVSFYLKTHGPPAKRDEFDWGRQYARVLCPAMKNADPDQPWDSRCDANGQAAALHKGGVRGAGMTLRSVTAGLLKNLQNQGVKVDGDCSSVAVGSVGSAPIPITTYRKCDEKFDWTMPGAKVFYGCDVALASYGQISGAGSNASSAGAVGGSVAPAAMGSAGQVDPALIVPGAVLNPAPKSVFTSGFKWRWGRMHRGIDLAGPVGTPIYAALDGVIASYRDSGAGGNWLIINHDGSVSGITQTAYGHLSALVAQVGQTVKKGQEVAKMGNTGRSTGPHLHFEIWIGGPNNRVNPLPFINPRPAGNG